MQKAEANEGRMVKKELLPILACPVCRGELELELTEERHEEIWSGYLICAVCQSRYPISEDIPNLIPLDREQISRR